jgi:DNA topoisomerase I
MSDFDVDSDDDYDDDPPLRNLKKKTQKSSNKQNTSTSKKSKLKKQLLEEKSKQRKSSSVRPDPAPSSNASSLKRKASNLQSSAVSSPKKKRKIETNGSSDKGSAIKSKSNAAALKEKDKSERLSYAMQSFLWWDAKEPPDGCQWVTMEHAGVSFPDPYEPHGVKLLYDGKPVDLTVAQEEA